MSAVNGINQSNFTTNVKTYGKGLLTDLKLSTPVLSEYATGDYYSKMNEVKQNLSNTQDGKEDNAFQKTIKGLGKQIVLSLPIIGTYVLGKTKNDHENAIAQLDANKNGTKFVAKESGVIKTFVTGLCEKLKHAVPFYGTYYRGQIANEVNNLYKESQVINEAINK